MGSIHGPIGNHSHWFELPETRLCRYMLSMRLCSHYRGRSRVIECTNNIRTRLDLL
jgi:hypothetical protein